MSHILEHARGATATAIIRLCVVFVVFLGALSDQPLIDNHASFPFILAGAAIYAAIAFAYARAGRPLSQVWTSVLDLGFVSALMLTSGGAFADVRLAFFLFPVVAAVTQGPRATARWTVLAVVAYITVSAVHDAGPIPGREATAATFSVYLLGIGAISVGIAEALRRRNERIEALAETSRTLAVRALEAEENERRRLAFALHDEPIQQLLAAQLDLDRAARGDLDAAVSARAAVQETIGQLRETIFELYPSSLEQLGLAAALEQLAGRIADRSGTEVELELDPRGAGELDRLLFSIGRELLRNAAEHASADRIELRLWREQGTVRLSVGDDGAGIAPGAVEEALRAGHLGLAAIRERAEARGGELTIESPTEGGTRVAVSLPTHEGDPA